MQLVQDKNQILFSKSDLMNSNNVQTIEWSQNLSSKKESFVQLMATLASDTTSQVLFFVQQSLADKLLSVSTPKGGDEYEVIVQPPTFRYGQDSATNTTFRFLVYLDPSYNPYQHRFLNQTTASKMADLAQKIPNVVPYVSYVKDAIKIAQNFIGDPLRSFEG